MKSDDTDGTGLGSSFSPLAIGTTLPPYHDGHCQGRKNQRSSNYPHNDERNVPLKELQEYPEQRREREQRHHQAKVQPLQPVNASGSTSCATCLAPLMNEIREARPDEEQRDDVHSESIPRIDLSHTISALTNAEP